MTFPQSGARGADRVRSLPSLSQTIDVETPELVVFSYTIAGVGSRALAAVIDSLICIAAVVAIVGTLAAVSPSRPERTGPGPGSAFDAWATAIVVLGVFCVLWGYYVLFEGLADGQTPGKRLLRLRVVLDGGYSVTFGASAVRNLVRVVDIQPIPCYVVGILSVIFSKSGKRLGDIVAGTIVVREALIRQLAPSEPSSSPDTVAALDTALTEEEFTVLERFMERQSSFDSARRNALAEQLTTRLASALPSDVARTTSAADLAVLGRLYDAERAARARGVAAREQRGAARERNVLLATRSPRWNAFAARLADAQRRGLRSLGEDGVRDFVAEYRDLASDLARLRTAAQGRDTPELFYLSRLLAGAHNLLYRGRTLTLTDVVRLAAIEAPREVRRSWRPILLAGVLLFGPAVIAYDAVVRQPAVAATFIPAAMLDRAEEGVRRARERKGYIPDPEIFRPTMASQIIANNVQVTFGAFAFGITAGIGTVLLLVMNGVSFGGILGLYQSKGILTLIIAFVAPHGVLELTAVCIAGGAGFLLAAALLLPGRRTRRRALVENGRRAIRLVAAATVLLLVAGTLEGFVSPIPSWPLGAKLAVSGATLVLLVIYLSSGRERRSLTIPAQAEPAEDSRLSTST
ncbi:MAG TPA: stage II sporulation protein M [Gemmatimonadaceae bacterium]|nr:stage II sporulation protein M [Gemmatimonadaceae bacterium]